jgi:hypothetical protein
MTQDAPPSEAVTPIGDKVRFWQEQDKINQALIPRVLKLHAAVTEMTRERESASLALGALEARIVKELTFTRKVAWAALVAALAAIAVAAFPF